MSTNRKPPVRSPQRLSQASQINALKKELRRGWNTASELIERTSTSRASFFRYIKIINEEESIEQNTIDNRAYYRLPAKESLLRLTEAEMIALAFVLQSVTFLEGTGLDDDVRSIVEKVTAMLRKNEYALWENLRHKLFDMNEMAYDYGDKLDVMNELMTALVREETVECRSKQGYSFTLDPYTLVLYKKGLYILGKSHGEAELRKYGIDKIEEVVRTGKRFEYPRSFTPKDALKGAFGMIRGERERVSLVFEHRSAPFVRRRKIHETQRFTETEEGLSLEMDPEGAKECAGWALSFGSKVKVLEPAWLREHIIAEFRRGLRLYGER